MEVPWWTPPLSGNEEIEISKVLRSGFINDGQEVINVEGRLSEILGVRNIICTSSGTAAITLLLMGLGVKNGSRVGVSNLTFIATANAASILGCEVVLIDVDENSGIIDINDLKVKLISGIDLLIVTHVSGRNCLTSEMISLLSFYGTPFIEDTAEGLGSRLDTGENLGNLGLGGTFSFSPNKVLTSGQGGFISVKDDGLANKLRSIKNQGRRGKSTGGDDTHEDLGWNFKWTNVQAAMINTQLPFFKKRIEHLKTIGEFYDEIFAHSHSLKVNRIGLSANGVFLWPEIQSEKRDEFTTQLDKFRIGYRNMWHPLNTQNPYLKNNSSFPGSQKYSKKTVWLASSFKIEGHYLEYLRQTLKVILLELDQK